MFNLSQLGLILGIRIPPITTGMHGDSRVSIYIILSWHFFLIFRRPSQFRELSVDPQVRTSDGRTSDVLFVGTTEGRILKIVNTADPTNYRASRYIFSSKLLSIQRAHKVHHKNDCPTPIHLSVRSMMPFIWLPSEGFFLGIFLGLNY